MHGPAAQEGWPAGGRALLAELSPSRQRGAPALIAGSPKPVDDLVARLAVDLHLEVVHLGPALCDRPTPPTEADLITAAASASILADLDLVFWPELCLQPLTLLSALARNHLVIAVWPGDISAGRARYSRPGRPDHHDHPIPGALVLRPRASTFPDEVPYEIERIPRMKYAELIAPSEPLERVKQIRESASLDAARRDVETFVISDRMADQLAGVVFANLRFDRPGDQKGLLTVATYGTGKTHLMSVVAAVAEHAELVGCLTNESVQEVAGSVAGRFKVVRFDIGATSMGLRDIVCAELARGLAGMGVDHAFPDWAKVTNTKDALADMMASFEAVHPDHGLLFVLDEMLDFLRLRRDAELISDLVFLREVGEICRSTRFRFLSGVQESVFDNPRFSGVADVIRRVRDRFDQVRIDGQDVAFVVERRLLRKDATQRARIRNHLSAFTSLYEGMAENLEHFVALFPVHPDYLATFEQISLVEKREVLRTIEAEMALLADQELPSDSPGLICSDSYRARLAQDPSVRTIPEVRAVLDKSGILRDKVRSALPERAYVDTALRIIDGLAVHRLTTEDIHWPIGMSPEMLRDQLCLLPPGLPERDAFFLRTTVASIITKVQSAVSGQFISVNPDNGQAYLDITKDIDYDRQIEHRAESLDKRQLDEAYYLAMEEVLELREAPYVAGYRIWAYHLPWEATNSDRLGYLFMGAPNERSTAQPPRDFYVYFLQPFDPPSFTDQEGPDEVLFRLATPEDAFSAALRRYAGSTAKARESTAIHRPIYQYKASESLRKMVTWLRSNMGRAMMVTYQGTTKPLASWLEVLPGDLASVADQVVAVASGVLGAHFAARYPGYPRFARHMTRSAFDTDVKLALTQIAAGRATAAGTAILRALELLGTDGALRANGTYAAHLLDALAGSGGRVLNRSDLLAPLDSHEVMRWGPWHLEPAWLMVVAAACCQLGRLELSVASRRIGALGLDQLLRASPEELANFDHLAPPLSLPLEQLAAVVALLDLPPGALAGGGVSEPLVRQVLTRSVDLLTRVDRARSVVLEGAECWGEHLFDLAEERVRPLDQLRDLLLDLRVRDSVGKLNGITLPAATLERAKAGRAELVHVESVLAGRDKLAPVADYLREACNTFGPDVEVVTDGSALRTELCAALRVEAEVDPVLVMGIRKAGEELRRRFVDLASRSYRHAHLDAAGAAAKRSLLAGDTLSALVALKDVSILPAGALARLRAELDSIKVLLDIDEGALARSVRLPGQPAPSAPEGPSAVARLQGLQDRLSALLAGWVQTLLDSLATQELVEQVGFLPAAERAEVESFVAAGALPSPPSLSFVAAVNQVFKRVDIRYLAPDELAQALFPDATPATASDLHARLGKLLDEAIGTTAHEGVRFLRSDDQP